MALDWSLLSSHIHRIGTEAYSVGVEGVDVEIALDLDI
jgi:hypothetical protein